MYRNMEQIKTKARPHTTSWTELWFLEYGNIKHDFLKTRDIYCLKVVKHKKNIEIWCCCYHIDQQNKVNIIYSAH